MVVVVGGGAGGGSNVVLSQTALHLTRNDEETRESYRSFMMRCCSGTSVRSVVPDRQPL